MRALTGWPAYECWLWHLHSASTRGLCPWWITKAEMCKIGCILSASLPKLTFANFPVELCHSYMWLTSGFPCFYTGNKSQFSRSRKSQSLFHTTQCRLRENDACTNNYHTFFLNNDKSQSQATSITPSASSTDPSPLLCSLTCALAVLHVRLQLPALVTRAFHAELVLFAALTAFQVFGTEALDLTGLVVRSQLHAQWTGTDHTLTRRHCAVMAAVAIVQWTKVCGRERQRIKGGVEKKL